MRTIIALFVIRLQTNIVKYATKRCKFKTLITNIDQLMFKEEDYGKPITEKLSITLRRNSSKDDFANIATVTDVSFSTIRDVVYRTNSLTRSNSKAILELIRISFDNSLARQLQAEGDKQFLNKFLPQ